MQGYPYEFLYILKKFDERKYWRIKDCVARGDPRYLETRPQGFDCKSLFCPRCQHIISHRVWSRLQVLADAKNLYFMTFTWQKGVAIPLLGKEMKYRRLHITQIFRIFEKSRVFYRFEFTQRQDQTVHLHIHSVVQMDEPYEVKQLFDSYGKRFCDVRLFDGDTREVSKYLTPDLNSFAGEVYGSLPYKCRISGTKNLKQKPIESILEDGLQEKVF